jgi:hypothetical protein
VVPPFFSDAIQALWDFWDLILAHWEALAVVTRVLIAMAAAALSMYGGSRAEQTSLSTMLFFAAFGFFAYIVAAGYSIFQ